MEKYSVGDVVMVEATGSYGHDVWVDGVVVNKDGSLMVKVNGFQSGEETENLHDYETQFVSLDCVIG